MMHHTEAFASDDATLADWLAAIHRTRINEEGNREIFDPNAGLWFEDSKAVEQARMRERRRHVLGSERDTAALNNYERGIGY